MHISESKILQQIADSRAAGMRRLAEVKSVIYSTPDAGPAFDDEPQPAPPCLYGIAHPKTGKLQTYRTFDAGKTAARRLSLQHDVTINLLKLTHAGRAVRTAVFFEEIA